MPHTLHDRLCSAPIIPLIDDDNAERSVRTAAALRDGGLGVIEVVMRSDGAQAAMEAVIGKVEDVVVGAGTVLTLDQAKSVLASGAQFVVSPGLVEDIVEHCLGEGVPVYPGTMTAGEVQRAHAMGLDTVKFFPASLAGGVPMLKALSAVFRQMRFMPTGGISPQNLAEYLALDGVIACGGSWLTPDDANASGDFAQITRLAQEALRIAGTVRG
ncbi:bifunctional 4-hydroxy-2-oxoglutarate aldolase/2-dehydro-3-deoxy-phosphogluconate aldolase [Qipengyuania sp. MTN3-11]|uniref:bifunctional 4-hydroxy-2-oxoglutarate aldolase/2-dehydro-3-deoxy-phosphogluconate aldolase n=1 Tax=Qipengyuania sp. MTN3-11 TaxID=3056557 RepID=UPI0036F2E910